MAKIEKDPREIAARALCRHDGLPEEDVFDGRPNWESYLEEVDVVLGAVGFKSAKITSVNDNWKS